MYVHGHIEKSQLYRETLAWISTAIAICYVICLNFKHTHNFSTLSLFKVHKTGLSE